jgi:hypothetical protein
MPLQSCKERLGLNGALNSTHRNLFAKIHGLLQISYRLPGSLLHKYNDVFLRTPISIAGALNTLKISMNQ